MKVRASRLAARPGGGSGAFGRPLAERRPDLGRHSLRAWAGEGSPMNAGADGAGDGGSRPVHIFAGSMG